MNYFKSILNNLQTRIGPNPYEEIRRQLHEIPVYSFMGYLSSNVVKERECSFFFFDRSDCEAVISEGKAIGLERPYLTDFPLAWPLIDFDGDIPNRLVPDISQVKHAIKLRQKAGSSCDSFSGVPIFQSDALRKMADGSSINYCRPAFFRKEDLERALREEKNLNQIDLEKHIIQVTALEDIIQEMKDCPTSKWNDVVFIPPGNCKL